MHPLSLLNFLLKPAGKIVNLIGLKIISNVKKPYSTYDSLKYCLCSDIVMRLSFFFPKFFHLQPHSHLHQLNFSVSVLKIQHYDTSHAYIVKN